MSATPKRSYARSVGLYLALSVAVGLMFSAGQLDRLPLSIAVSLMYSIAIGVPSGIALRRLRPRLAGKPELRQWLSYFGVILSITIVATLLIRLALVGFGVLDLEQMWDGFIVSLEISMAIAVPCSLGAATFAKLHSRLADSEREKLRALSLATEARLASLESRVRPHFLFNALNSAIALIPEDPRRAEQVLERLCALLRFSLDATARLVPLGEEMRIVTDYLEIERVRFGDRLSYELDVPDAIASIMIPAFAVQTLVENCVKYAVSVRTQGAHITVRARQDGPRLVLEICDDGPGFVGPVWVAGHGLDGLRARLDALYGHAARLVVPAAAAAGAAVTIELPAAAP